MPINMKLQITLAKIAKILLAPVFAVLVMSCATATANGKITLQELLTYKTIRVGDLKKLNLDVKLAHGPIYWAMLDDKDKKDVWFIFSPGISAVFGMAKIDLIATGDANYMDVRGTIIWPKDKVGHDYGKELETLYKKEK